MSKRTKSIAIIIVLLGLAIGAQYVSAALGHRGTNNAAATISPEELTRAAGALPVTVIDSYF
jgi:hypothetical protein